jgi:hypothetical protein
VVYKIRENIIQDEGLIELAYKQPKKGSTTMIISLKILLKEATELVVVVAS